MTDNTMKTMTSFLHKGKKENTRNLNVKMTKRKAYAESCISVKEPKIHKHTIKESEIDHGPTFKSWC